MKKLLLVSLSLILVTLYIFNFHNTKQRTQTAKAAEAVTAPKAVTEQLESYSYVITEIDESGLYGDSLTDDTGIYIDAETIKGMKLKENDHISVTFPKDDYETITKVEKIKSAPAKPKEPQYKTFTYTITEINENDYYGKAKDNTGIYFTSDFIKGNKINIGDSVTAYFDPVNTEDGLIYVKKN